jgi:hypothetical protein
MTELTPDLPCYVITVGTRGWMVWDRQSKAPVKFLGSPAIGLTEERAREIREELLAGT